MICSSYPSLWWLPGDTSVRRRTSSSWSQTNGRSSSDLPSEGGWRKTAWGWGCVGRKSSWTSPTRHLHEDVLRPLFDPGCLRRSSLFSLDPGPGPVHHTDRCRFLRRRSSPRSSPPPITDWLEMWCLLLCCHEQMVQSSGLWDADRQPEPMETFPAGSHSSTQQQQHLYTLYFKLLNLLVITVEKFIFFQCNILVLLL